MDRIDLFKLARTTVLTAALVTVTGASAVVTTRVVLWWVGA